MRRRARPSRIELLPANLRRFDEAAWPAHVPDGAPGTPRQWARMRWNRARSQWLRGVGS